MSFNAPDRDNIMLDSCYNMSLEELRSAEYPSLQNKCYLDHAGTTIYSKSLVSSISSRLVSNVFANPHSQSLASKLTESTVDNVRLQVLELFGCDPVEFGVIFTANATHAIKILVQDGFSNYLGNAYNDNQFDYLYADNSHTSMIGVREYANFAQSFTLHNSDAQGLSSALDQLGKSSNEYGQSNLSQKRPDRPLLVSWSGQSNFNGERVDSKHLIETVKNCTRQTNSSMYTLLDASSLSTTKPPNFANDFSKGDTPDFMVVSFYKIFGLPDLGALVFNKKKATRVFKNKKYFGGGTVDALTLSNTTRTIKEAEKCSAFVKRSQQLAAKLEDGTLPLHSIVSLEEAIKCHKSLYGSFANVTKYVTELSNYAVHELSAMKYPSGNPMIEILGNPENYGNSTKQGPIITFFLTSELGKRLGYHDFETIASLRDITVRTGTLCNIGGYLYWSKNEISEEDIISNYFQYSHRCGDNQDLIDGKVTGAIRISFGAMSTKQDVDYFCASVIDFFENTLQRNAKTGSELTNKDAQPSLTYPSQRLSEAIVGTESNQGKVTALGAEDVSTISSDKSGDYAFNTSESESEMDERLKVKVTSLYIYPIKSCHFYKIPENFEWEIDRLGLKYDRFFCLLDINTKQPLKLKNCTKMVNLKPVIDLQNETMILHYSELEGSNQLLDQASQLVIPLSRKKIREKFQTETVYHKNDNIEYEFITDRCVVRFLQSIVGMPCFLATGKDNLTASAISMQNASPFLLITKPSVEKIINRHRSSSRNQKEAMNVEHLFRANIMVDSSLDIEQRRIGAFEEDFWKLLTLQNSASGKNKAETFEPLVFENYLKCTRCHMITINQETGERDSTVFMHLNATRKSNGKVYFGQNLKLYQNTRETLNSDGANGSPPKYYIKVNDELLVSE